MPLASTQDLLLRYDRRLLADLAGDENEPTDPADSERVQAALEGASGQLLAAARLGGRYREEELQELSGPDREFLADVVCALALVRLIGVRVQTIGAEAYQVLRENTEKILDDLRAGKMLFGTPSAQRAATPAVDGPSVLDYQRLNLISSRVRNYYPFVASRLPLGR